MKNLKAIRAHALQLGEVFVQLRDKEEARIIDVVALRWSENFQHIVVTGVRGDLAMLGWDEVVYIVPPKVFEALGEG
jgi:hypothetical protein